MSLLELAIPGWGQMTATVRAVRAGVMAAAVIVPALGWGITAHTLHGVREWQRGVISVTSAAGHVVDKKGRPALLAAKDVAAQIKMIGDALDAVPRAQARATDIMKGSNWRVETAQTEIGRKVDDAHTANLVRDRADVDGFIRAGGVRRPHGAAAIDQRASSEGGASGAAAGAGPADGPATVLVLADDVRRCSDIRTTLTGLQDWERKIEALPTDLPAVPDSSGS
jgi:hypothetical protein